MTVDTSGRRAYVAVLVAALVALCVMLFGHRQATFRRVGGVVWTTEYNITYESAAALDDSVTAALNAVDGSVSMFNPRSSLSLCNSGRQQRADAALTQVYNRARRVWRESGGAFDPTVGPLVNAWGFGYRNGALPDSAAVAAMLGYVGLDRTSIGADGIISRQDGRVVIDFSSIAKGFACDEVGRMLRRNGVENFIVEIGGEVCASGHNALGKPWHVQVDRPEQSADTVSHHRAMVLALPAEGAGVATSGNYRNFKVVDGKVISHIINPATGFPASTSVVSATVVAADCMDADAYATACMVMGADKALRMVDANGALECMLIEAGPDGALRFHFSRGFKKMCVVE